MEETLSQAKKISEHAEVFQTFFQKTPVNFEANNLKQIETKESTGTALRLIKDGRIGFAHVSGKFDPQTLVNMALETSKFGAVAKFGFPGPQTYPQVEIYDAQVSKVNLNDMVQLGEQFIAAIRQHTPDISCEASVSKGTASVHIINSNGGKVSYEKSFFTLALEGVLIQDDDMLFVGDYHCSCHPILDFKVLSEEIITQLELAKRKAKISTGQMPVIFKPSGVGSALIAPLLSAFNGKVVFNGASPLKDKLGVQFFDQKLTLWDDATIPYHIASSPCDDEGIPGQRTTLIDKGMVSQFFYDLQTAGLSNTQSTGNGGRNGGLPSPSANSLIINEGNTSLKDMVKDIKQGLIIEDLMGASQGNTLNGDFSGNVLLGYKIENGEIVGRVKNTMVSGNVYQVLKHIEAVGQDTRWLGGFLRTPSLYCSDIAVAAKEE